jgi:hypothetical protein
MKSYQLVLEETATKRRERIDIDATEFSSAASQAYLKKHTRAYAGTGWKIISLAESGWQVVKLP